MAQGLSYGRSCVCRRLLVQRIDTVHPAFGLRVRPAASEAPGTLWPTRVACDNGEAQRTQRDAAQGVKESITVAAEGYRLLATCGLRRGSVRR